MPVIWGFCWRTPKTRCKAEDLKVLYNVKALKMRRATSHCENAWSPTEVADMRVGLLNIIESFSEHFLSSNVWVCFIKCFNWDKNYKSTCSQTLKKPQTFSVSLCARQCNVWIYWWKLMASLYFSIYWFDLTFYFFLTFYRGSIKREEMYCYWDHSD